MSTTISADAWRAEIERLSRQPSTPRDGGLRYAEVYARFRERFGWSEDTMRAYLRAQVASGAMLAYRALRPNLAGTPTSIVVYRLAPKAAKRR